MNKTLQDSVGTKTAQPPTLFASAEITFDSSDNDEFILTASFNRVPADPATETLSEPARSMRLREAVCGGDVGKELSEHVAARVN